MVEALDIILALMLLAISAGGVGFSAGVMWSQLRQIDRCGPVEGVPDDNN